MIRLLLSPPTRMGRTCTHIQQSILGQMQVAMWLEIFIIKKPIECAWLMHATNKFFLIFFLEPEGQ